MATFLSIKFHLLCQGGEIDELMPAGEVDEVPDDKDEPPRAVALKVRMKTMAISRQIHH